MNKAENYTIIIIFFIFLFLLPMFLTRKGNRFRGIIILIGIINSLAIVPSMYFDYGTMQNLIIAGWVVSFILVFVGRKRRVDDKL